MRTRFGLKVASMTLFGSLAVHVPAQTVTVGATTIRIDHNSSAHANPGFYFGDAPRPSTNDAGTVATFSILEGEAAPRSGGLDALHDGRLPSGADRPDQNFFFANGTDGGLVRIDLGQRLPVQAVNTYSCHPWNRAPQIYSLYGSIGDGANFVPSPHRGDDLQREGWNRIASVATGMRGDFGGQWAVSVMATNGSLGQFRYLLLDIRNPELNTFYSEIDVFAENGRGQLSLRPDTMHVFGAGRYRIVIDTSKAPEMTEWARSILGPAAKEWYPKIAQLLASPGFDAPPECTIDFRDLGAISDAPGQVVAFTEGTRVTCRAEWFRQNTTGEACGCVVHELVHVIQQYPQQRGATAQEGQVPDWLVEGIADYIRWFLFEPQSHGAEITTESLSAARYDASYRITGNFLNWIAQRCGTNVIARINEAARDGKYSPTIWKEITGREADELGREWRQTVEARLQPRSKAETSPAK
ncbi:MAG: basic secretory protein-like protein [Limisphaerales bacterium]